MANWCPEKYKEAWNFASVAHRGQTYGGWQEGMQVDYLNHIGSVAMEVIWALSDEDHGNLAVQCAILHDTIEDTETTYGEILSLFGKAVAEGVQALSKNQELPTKREQMLDSLKRIKQQPKEVWMVKLGDRITNLYHPVYYWKPEKIKSYREEALIIYEELKDCNDKLAKRLLNKIDEYKKFMK